MLRLSEARFYEKLVDYESSGEQKYYVMIQTFKRHLKIKKMLDEIYMEEFGKKEDKQLKGEWMLTIRPSEDMPLQRFIEFTKKLFEKKLFGCYKYTYEQKGECEEELGKGKHFHAICNLVYSSKGIKWHINEIMRLVKKLKMEDYILSNSIHLRKIISEEDMVKANNYINTEMFGKHDASKRKCWEWDGEWRKRHHLLPIYDGNSVPPKQAQGTVEQIISKS